MGLTLPDARYITEDIRLASSRNELRSATGTNLQRIGRKGSRYIAVFECEPMTLDEARDWGDLESEDETVVAHIVQPGVDVGAPGNDVRVNGAGQAGASLILDGLTPNYIIRKRQPLTHVSATGVRRLYMSAALVVVNASGQATVPLRTMLNAPPADNDVVLLAAPVIEGFPMLEEGSWLIDGNGFVHIRFTVEEPG